jgi:GNAT superfamily N-acetyltransferase
VAIVAVSARERPDLAERAREFEGVWPEYNMHAPVTNRYWQRLYEDFPAFQFVLYDDETDVVLAEGQTIPFVWDGTPEGLPDGLDGLLEDVFEGPAGEPTALSALAAEIPPEHQSRGLSGRLLEEMAAVAREHGLADLVAPLRPSWKERYPLTPIEDYVGWMREDGLPLDPWLRVHVRMGAEALRPEPRSLRIEGTVAEWEEWVGLAFPQSGDYVFPRGLATVAIDRDADRGLYFEPNVWVRHRVAA